MMAPSRERPGLTCQACGAFHGLDINAAKNILAAGRAERLNAVEPM
jgi:putative transposase